MKVITPAPAGTDLSPWPIHDNGHNDAHVVAWHRQSYALPFPCVGRINICPSLPDGGHPPLPCDTATLAGNDLDPVSTPGTLCFHRAASTGRWRGRIFPIAQAVGGAIVKCLSVRAHINVLLTLVGKCPLGEITVPVIGSTITDHAVDVALFQSSADGWCEIAGIWVGGADLGRFCGGSLGGFLFGQGWFAVRCTVFVDGCVQFGEVVHWGLLYYVYLVFVLIGIGLEVGAVRIKHATTDESVLNGLFDNGIEDRLVNVGINKAPTVVLGEGGGINDLVGEAHA